jgi:hypothetical protein
MKSILEKEHCSTGNYVTQSGSRFSSSSLQTAALNPQQDRDNYVTWTREFHSCQGRFSVLQSPIQAPTKMGSECIYWRTKKSWREARHTTSIQCQRRWLSLRDGSGWSNKQYQHTIGRGGNKSYETIYEPLQNPRRHKCDMKQVP